jgi:[ribosomal protein S5]-alanine N-acetyltransferase
MHVIETARLELRWLTIDDAPFVIELVNDPEWLRFIGDRGVHDLDSAHAYMVKGPLALYAKWGYGLYVVERKDDGAPIGLCGLVRREGLDDADLGFALLPRFRAQGYAAEAAVAVLAHARQQLGLERIVAITSPGNAESIRLLEHVGFAFERMVQLGEKDPVMLFAACA